MTPWRIKAHREIERLCRDSYLQANRYKDGTYRTQHVPYSVPHLAEMLIACLDTDDESSAKATFMQMACSPEWERDPENR